MAIIYLSRENKTCPKEQIMHKDLYNTCPYCAEPIYTTPVNSFGNSMEQDKYSETGVYPDQLLKK